MTDDESVKALEDILYNLEKLKGPAYANSVNTLLSIYMLTRFAQSPRNLPPMHSVGAALLIDSSMSRTLTQALKAFAQTKYSIGQTNVLEAVQKKARSEYIRNLIEDTEMLRKHQERLLS